MNYLFYGISGFIVLRLISKWRRNHKKNLELARKLEASIRKKSTIGNDKAIIEFQDFVELVGKKHVPLDLPKIVYDSHLKVLQQKRSCYSHMTTPKDIEAMRQSIVRFERESDEFKTKCIENLE